MKQIIYMAPLLLLLSALFFFQKGLHNDPHLLPSTRINHSAPHFHLTSWPDHEIFSDQDFKNKITLLHVFATWCETCQAELPVLQKIATDPKVTLYAIAYKDTPDALNQWFKTQLNPYQKIGLDTDGTTGVEWGVYGTPETFVIDQSGIVRYKYVGPLTETLWKNTLKHFF